VCFQSGTILVSGSFQKKKNLELIYNYMLIWESLLEERNRTWRSVFWGLCWRFLLHSCKEFCVKFRFRKTKFCALPGLLIFDRICFFFIYNYSFYLVQEFRMCCMNVVLFLT
jgi:hypothetical protein